MMYDVEMFKRTMKQVEVAYDAGEFDMGNWGHKVLVNAETSECKTSACMAGHTLIANGCAEWEGWTDDDEVSFDLTVSDDAHIAVSGVGVWFGAVAVKALELLIPGSWDDKAVRGERERAYYTLFMAVEVRTPEQLWGKVEAFTDGAVKREDAV